MSRAAIAHLVHRYADAVVHHDESAWSATWSADGVWRLGDRRVEGRDAIVAEWLATMERFAAVVHQVTNGTVEIGPDAGTGRWYVTEHWRTADGTPGLLLGHYDDTYVRIDDEWRFASRALTAHYLGPPDLSAPFRTRTT